MILESLLTDGSKLTLDCAKATLSKGSKVEIPDEFYPQAEVQNAIKMGLIKLVGEPPAAAAAVVAADEKRRKFRNMWGSKLTFECIKDYVDPGCFIHVPESKLTNSEIQNAIAWGMLVDPDAPKAEEKGPRHTAEIDEIKVDESAKVAPKIKARPGKAPAPAGKSPIKAKKITSKAESDDGEESDDGLYKESQVIVPKTEQPLKAPPNVEVPTEAPVEAKAKPSSRFDFLDIFEDEPGDKDA